MILHLVSKSPTQSDVLNRCLSVLATGDAILLIQEGVYAGQNPQSRDHLLKQKNITLYALKDDVNARGLMPHWDEKIKRIDYVEFVQLSEKADKIISWF